MLLMQDIELKTDVLVEAKLGYMRDGRGRVVEVMVEGGEWVPMPR